jgi:hypothetical protein
LRTVPVKVLAASDAAPRRASPEVSAKRGAGAVTAKARMRAATCLDAGRAPKRRKKQKPLLSIKQKLLWMLGTALGRRKNSR